MKLAGTEGPEIVVINDATVVAIFANCVVIFFSFFQQKTRRRLDLKTIIARFDWVSIIHHIRKCASNKVLWLY